MNTSAKTVVETMFAAFGSGKVAAILETVKPTTRSGFTTARKSSLRAFTKAGKASAPFLITS